MLADSVSAQAPGEVLWRFGSFVLWEFQRRIERHGKAVRMGSRSFDLLLVLLKRAGEVISNGEFLAAVWSGVVVEEASVRVHMSNLRKALGKPGPEDDCTEWIANVPLRGYRFVGRVHCQPARSTAPSDMPPAAMTVATTEWARLPARLSRLIGRDTEVESVLQALACGRLVSVVGAAGIGKTGVAIQAVEKLEAQAPALVGFVDVASFSSRDPMLAAMAKAFGIPADAVDPLQAITQRLAGHEVLLLVDNCDHVVEPLSNVIIELVAALPSLRVLATSREALRIDGEHVLRLSPLGIPAGHPASLEEALRSPAVELLVERAQACGAAAFDDGHAALLASICRKVDGIPLAIELVAARLGAQPIGDLANRLDDSMRLYWTGNRVAIARHRSLAAALDWSIALLDGTELDFFRRLSVLQGRFDVESALGAARGTLSANEAMNTLISLVCRSLVSFDPDHAQAPYRLLDTTRSYAQLLLLRCEEYEAAPHGAAGWGTHARERRALRPVAGPAEHRWPIEHARALYLHALAPGAGRRINGWGAQHSFALAHVEAL